MILLDKIKSDRTLTFSFWRYQLLHWFWGIAPKTPADSCLPKWFYTHYCPLFHFTNLVAIFSPVIFVIKLVWTVAKLCYLLFDRVFEFLAQIVFYVTQIAKAIRRRRKAQTKPKKEQLSEEEVAANLAAQLVTQREYEIRLIPSFLLQEENWKNEFDYFYYKKQHRFSQLEMEEVKKIWEKYVARIREAKELEEARREKVRAWIVFFVNFSRIFIKATLNIVYAALTLLVGWVAWKWGIPTFLTIGGFITSAFWVFILFDWLDALVAIVYYGSRIIGSAFVLGLVGYVFYKLVVWSNLPMKWMWQKTLPPLQAVGDSVFATTTYIESIFSGVVEFFSMFYEENCPGITIVAESSPEAEIASKLGEEN